MNKISFIIFNIYDWIMRKLEKIGGMTLLLLFAFALSANASELVANQQTVDTSTYSPIYGIAQNFISSTSNITAIEWSPHNALSNATTSLYLCQGIATTTSNSITCGSNTQLKYKQEILTGAGVHKMSFATTTLLTGQSYYFVIAIQAGFAVHQDNISDATSNYYSVSYGGGMAKTYSGHMYYKTYYDTAIVGLSDLQVSLITPANYATMGLYSPVFRGNFRDDGHTATDIVLTIYNAQLNSYNTKSFSLASTSIGVYAKTFGTIIDTVSTPMGYSQIGTSSWTAYLVNGSTTISNVPSANVFVIGTSTYVQNASFTEDNVCATNDLSTISGQFACSLKLAMAWLVYPSQSSLDSLQVAGQDIKNSFPFSVYFQLTDVVQNTISSTTLNMNGSIGIPMINKSGDIYVAPFISSSTLPNAVGQTNAYLIRNTFSWLIWIFLAIFLFIEIKKI